MLQRENLKKGMFYLCLALFVFAGLGIEVIYGMLIEPFLYQRQMNDWTVAQNISHWVITCITWGLITYGILAISKTKVGFHLFTKRGSMKPWQWIGVFLFIAFSLIVSYWDWNGIKIVKEYQYNGLLKFIFQYIYYVFETALITMMLVFGQKAFEEWNKNRFIPYGGILLALTWGLAHIPIQGSVTSGLVTTVGAFTYGIVYLLVNRDIKKAFPIILVMLIV